MFNSVIEFGGGGDELVLQVKKKKNVNLFGNFS